eukprot:scaffold181741_cov19-Tisochrysis_lutea.AAC.1
MRLLARRAEAARTAINEEGMAKAQEADAARERARAAKDLQAAQVRVARVALLAEQRRALDERAAAAIAAKEARIAEEQKALADAGACACARAGVCGVLVCGCECGCERERGARTVKYCVLVAYFCDFAYCGFIQENDVAVAECARLFTHTRMHAEMHMQSFKALGSDGRAASRAGTHQGTMDTCTHAHTHAVLQEHAAAVAELRAELARTKARDSAQAARRGSHAGSGAMNAAATGGAPPRLLDVDGAPAGAAAAGLSGVQGGAEGGVADVLGGRGTASEAVRAQRLALARYEWRTRRLSLSGARLAMIEAVELGELTELQATPPLAAQAAREQAMALALQLRAAPVT